MTQLQMLFAFGVINALLVNVVESKRSPRGAGAFVVGGTETEEYTRPYQVVVNFYDQKEKSWAMCGGAIVDEFWILTAAHCVPASDWRNANMSVTAAEHDLSVDEYNEQKRGVKDIFVHPGWDSNGGNDMDNDIALILLEKNLWLGGKAEPITLNDAATCPEAGVDCVVSGWGKTGDNEDVSDILLEAPVNVMTNDECNTRYEDEDIKDGQLCAATLGKTDSCEGDSGGPLVCMCGGKQVHSGVVSFGQDCGSSRYPGVYARTSFYLPWIECTMETHGKDC